MCSHDVLNFKTSRKILGSLQHHVRGLRCAATRPGFSQIGVLRQRRHRFAVWFVHARIVGAQVRAEKSSRKKRPHVIYPNWASREERAQKATPACSSVLSGCASAPTAKVALPFRFPRFPTGRPGIVRGFTSNVVPIVYASTVLNHELT